MRILNFISRNEGAFYKLLQCAGEVCTFAAEFGVSHVGFQAAEIGKTALAATALITAAGAALGAKEGAERANAGAHHRIALALYDTEVLPGAMVLGFSQSVRHIKPLYVTCYVGSIALMSKGYVASVVQLGIATLRRRARENVEVSPTKKAVEWAAGAAAGVLATGAMASSGIITASMIGALASRATRAVVRTLQTTEDLADHLFPG